MFQKLCRNDFIVVIQEMTLFFGHLKRVLHNSGRAMKDEKEKILYSAWLLCIQRKIYVKKFSPKILVEKFQAITLLMHKEENEASARGDGAKNTAKTNPRIKEQHFKRKLLRSSLRILLLRQNSSSAPTFQTGALKYGPVTSLCH